MTQPATLEGILEAHGHSASVEGLHWALARTEECEWYLREVTAAHIREDQLMDEEMYELIMHFLYGMDWRDMEWPRYRLVSRGTTVRGPTGRIKDLMEVPGEEAQAQPLLIVSANNEGRVYRRHKRWHKGSQTWVSLTS